MNEKIKSDLETPGSTQSVPTKEKNKGGLGQKIWRCCLGICFIAALCIGFLTLRVNAQRAAIRGIMDADGDVSYRIERDATGRRIPADELGLTLRGSIGNMFGIDFVSDLSRINLGSTSGRIEGLLRSYDKNKDGTLDKEEQNTLGESENESAKRFVALIDSDIEDGITRDELTKAGEKLMETNLAAIKDRFTGLSQLVIDTNNISDLSFVSSLKDLQVLVIEENPISDLTPLIGLNQLERVVISGTEVKDLSALKDLTLLQRLHISKTQVTDLSPIEGLQNLADLRIDYTEVTTLESVGKLANLKTLNMQKTPITDLTPIGNLKKLTKVDLEDTNVTDVTPLKGADALVALVTGRSKVTPESADALKAALPKLVIGTKARPTSSFR